jgi:hypothetical protein
VAKDTPVSAAPKKELKEPKVVPQLPSNIEYIGVGAEKIKFTVDPRATSIRVYADGRILVDY